MAGLTPPRMRWPPAGSCSAPSRSYHDLVSNLLSTASRSRLEDLALTATTASAASCEIARLVVRRACSTASWGRWKRPTAPPRGDRSVPPHQSTSTGDCAAIEDFAAMMATMAVMGASWKCPDGTVGVLYHHACGAKSHADGVTPPDECLITRQRDQARRKARKPRSRCLQPAAPVNGLLLPRCKTLPRAQPAEGHHYVLRFRRRFTSLCPVRANRFAHL